MAGLSIGKRDVAKVAAVLDQQYETVEEAARAALEEAFAIYESKAKFTVVGQLRYSPEGGWLNHDDALACMVALGRYGTETQARNDAESFVVSKSTGEEFRAWVLPVYHGTPASYFTGRKDAKAEAAARWNLSQADRLSKALREEYGWATDQELAKQEAEAAKCPECGFPLDQEHDGLASGYEVKP